MTNPEQRDPGAPPDPAPAAGPDPAPPPRPDPAPSSDPDPALSSDPDPALSSDPDPAPSSGPDPAPSARPDSAPSSGPDPVPGAVADFAVPAAAGPPPAPANFAGEAGWPGYPAATARTRGRTALVAALVALGVAAFGGVVGWVWSEVAPRLQVIKAGKGLLYADAEPEQPIAADGWFFLLGLGLGIVLAVLAWVVLRRYRGAALLAGLTLGSFVGAIFALWVGYKISYGQFSPVAASAPVGTQLGAPITLHISDLSAAKLNADPVAALWAWPPRPNGLIAVQALAVAFVYTVLAGFSIYPDLSRHPGPTPAPAPGVDPS